MSYTIVDISEFIMPSMGKPSDILLSISPNDPDDYIESVTVCDEIDEWLKTTFGPPRYKYAPFTHVSDRYMWARTSISAFMFYDPKIAMAMKLRFSV